MLNPPQIEAVAEAMKWAKKAPMCIEFLNLTIVDPSDSTQTLGRIITNEYGYPLWTSEAE